MKNFEAKLSPWSLEWTGMTRSLILCDPTDMQHLALRGTSKSHRQQSRLEQQPVVDPNTGLGFVKETQLNKHFLRLYS